MKLGGPYLDVLYNDNFTCKLHRFDIGFHPDQIERAELMRCYEDQFPVERNIPEDEEYNKLKQVLEIEIMKHYEIWRRRYEQLQSMPEV